MTMRRGQALTELAIFGTFILVILGVMVNYGLNYDYNQYASMSAFRQALGKAAEELPTNAEVDKGPKQGKWHLNKSTWGTATATVMDDRHTPSPSDPFNIGNISTVGATASVLRTHEISATADTESELPRSQVVINGAPVNCPSAASHPSLAGCTMAGFRVEQNVTGIEYDDKRDRCLNDPDTVDDIDKYYEIFGAVEIPKTACAQAGKLREGETRASRPRTGTIRIIDPCEGEMIDKDACLRMARQITDADFCERECERGKPILPPKKKDPNDPDPPSCATICSKSVRVPWYAKRVAAGKGQFAIEAFFGDEIRDVGLQPDTRTRTTSSNRRDRGQSMTAIHNKDTVNVVQKTNRTFVYHQPSALANPAERRAKKGVLSEKAVGIGSIAPPVNPPQHTLPKQWTTPVE